MVCQGRAEGGTDWAHPWRGHSLKLHQERVRWDFRKDFSMERAAKHWNCPGRGGKALLRWLSVLCSWDSDFSNSNPNNSTIPSTSRSCCSPSLTHLAILLMALLGVTFGTLSMLAATVASFKAVGEGAEVRVLI